jgi:hypothetical protein
LKTQSWQRRTTSSSLVPAAQNSANSTLRFHAATARVQSHSSLPKKGAMDASLGGTFGVRRFSQVNSFVYSTFIVALQSCDNSTDEHESVKLKICGASSLAQ